MKPTGYFSTSNPLINQLQHNIQWGQKGNFLDVPTDCPQRDERLGWTGDAQVFSRTATFNMNVASFFTKWLKDVAADQLPDGVVHSRSAKCIGHEPGKPGGPMCLLLFHGTCSCLWRQTDIGRPVSEHEGLGRLHARVRAKITYGNMASTLATGSSIALMTIMMAVRQLPTNIYIAQSFYAYSTQLLINAARYWVSRKM